MEVIAFLFKVFSFFLCKIEVASSITFHSFAI